MEHRTDCPNPNCEMPVVVEWRDGYLRGQCPACRQYVRGDVDGDWSSGRGWIDLTRYTATVEPVQ